MNLTILCPSCLQVSLDISEWNKTNTEDDTIYYCDLCKTGFRIKVEEIRE